MCRRGHNVEEGHALSWYISEQCVPKEHSQNLTMSLVLVTGATGFLGSVIVDQLLEAGYKVRGTARSSKAVRLRAALASVGSNFEVAVVDDLASSDLTEAFKGVDFLIHAGSPLPGTAPADTILTSAISGTERVLQYALDAGVKKIVVTSSVATLSRWEDLWEDSNLVLTENDWNPQTWDEGVSPDATPTEIYMASKKLAETTLWNFAKEHPDIDITAILPPAIYGPGGHGQFIDTPANGTNVLVYKLLDGPKGRPLHDQYPAIVSFAHVNDIARAHVLALNAPPSNKPKRIIVVAGHFTWKDATEYLAKKRPELRDRLPVITGKEKVYETATYDASSAARLLGLTDYVGWKETLEFTIDYILRREKELGIVQP
ncbi:hypothetical protein EW146_g7609 [Bondarzewia mesenterica]|uniref:NAD-dependent epimerase/dehydratase domain-containing protein n=1 Tax=Bondarzewia mesenterica TaxID=1095465 RepID=A0A4S4LKA0_9AGAM|nr:hypothetical protein EW146_g7609 [Bondarzewia mesenterica]